MFSNGMDQMTSALEATDMVCRSMQEHLKYFTSFSYPRLYGGDIGWLDNVR